jgi:hypothetical protein
MLPILQRGHAVCRMGLLRSLTSKMSLSCSKVNHWSFRGEPPSSKVSRQSSRVSFHGSEVSLISSRVGLHAFKVSVHDSRVIFMGQGEPPKVSVRKHIAADTSHT